MNDSGISCIYYPTTVLVVDDNKSVLENIEIKIGKSIPCITYSNPNKALDFLQKQMARTDVLKDMIGIDQNFGDYSHVSMKLPIQYNIDKIFEHMKMADRFSEVSTIVLDYSMPGLSGEEICKRLQRPKGNPIKIIMLTGEADEPSAVRMFNLGIIDRFLMKSQPDVDEALRIALLEMQDRYFQDATYPIVRAISSDNNSGLGDPIVIDFFNKLKHDISATSYYLIEISGSFLLMDNAGKATFLFIKTIEELAEMADLMEDAEVSGNLVESVQKGKLIPYFGSEKEFSKAQKSTFEKCLYKANILKGNKDYAYAILKETPIGFPINLDEITSFNQYINQ